MALPGQANIVPTGEREAVCTGGVMNRVPCHMAAAYGGRKRVALVLEMVKQWVTARGADHPPQIPQENID